MSEPDWRLDDRDPQETTVEAALERALRALIEALDATIDLRNGLAPSDPDRGAVTTASSHVKNAIEVLSVMLSDLEANG
jgi:hypothetical protein